MNQLISALNQGQNALLEAPTGCGEYCGAWFACTGILLGLKLLYFHPDKLGHSILQGSVVLYLLGCHLSSTAMCKLTFCCCLHHTGKTLSLLVSSLAWQEKRKKVEIEKYNEESEGWRKRMQVRECAYSYLIAGSGLY